MSLEEALTRNSDLIEKLIVQNETILGIAASRQAAAAGNDGETTKPKRTTAAKDKAKEDTAGEDAAKVVTKTELSAAFAKWLNEDFGKPADGHPEAIARHTAFKTVLGKLKIEGGIGKGVADDDQATIDKLHGWLENTAKKADKGFGIGRLAADPEPAGDTASDDDLGV